jgi:5S rRNA maturation endonuclease (ribonuclease M5)
MRLDAVRVRDHRTVRDAPVDLRLGTAVTVLVGPNLAGKSNLARAVAAALDERVPFDLERERPAARPDAVPSVELHYHDRTHGRASATTVRVSWPLGQRVVDVRPALDVEAGPPVLGWAEDGPADVLARVADVLADEDPAALAADLLPTLRRVLPEVARIELPTGAGGEVHVVDRDGFPVGDHVVRATFAAAVAAHLVRLGADVPAVVVEEPEAFLHPGAQERLRDELVEVGVAADAPVLLTSESPFVVPRVADTRVVSVARDPSGRTRVVGEAAGDEPQAPLLGGLFRDGGIAAVLDRTMRIPPTATGVVVVEGGTDEAYLRLAARALGREDEVARLAIEPAGGALPAALQAVVLRAETSLPVLVLLDNDEQGRRAKQTLTSRFGLTNRGEVTTYAEVVPDHPVGTEAEDVFDWRLVERFVDEVGEEALRGKRVLRADEWHFDLTLSAKGAFVAWLEEHLEAAHCERWGVVLDLLAERLTADAVSAEPDG